MDCRELKGLVPDRVGDVASGESALGLLEYLTAQWPSLPQHHPVPYFARQARPKEFHGFVPFMKKLSSVMLKDSPGAAGELIQEPTKPSAYVRIGPRHLLNGLPVGKIQHPERQRLVPTPENSRR